MWLIEQWRPDCQTWDFIGIVATPDLQVSLRRLRNLQHPPPAYPFRLRNMDTGQIITTA